MMESVNIAAQLQRLKDAQLIRRADDDWLAYWFKHGLTQETAYQSRRVKKRREIHRQVAQALEEYFPQRPLAVRKS
jgi:predicted ATPase